MTDITCYWRNKTEECDYLTVYTDDLDAADKVNAKPVAVYSDMKDSGKKFAVHFNCNEGDALHKELVKKLHLTKNNEIKEKRTRKRKEK